MALMWTVEKYLKAHGGDDGYPPHYTAAYLGEDMESDLDYTVQNLTEDLDNYGGHLPLVIQSEITGKYYQVDRVGTMMRNGELITYIAIGDSIDL